MAAHDLRQSCSVWRATGRRFDHLGALAEILRTEGGRRDHTERLHILASGVIEAPATRPIVLGSRSDLSTSRANRTCRVSASPTDKHQGWNRIDCEAQRLYKFAWKEFKKLWRALDP
jgi:hypothetical protein